MRYPLQRFRCWARNRHSALIFRASNRPDYLLACCVACGKPVPGRQAVISVLGQPRWIRWGRRGLEIGA